MSAVRMNVHSITIDPSSNSPILILKEVEGDRSLPIWIGLLEATAIATEMEKISFARPMTHDLAVALLNALEVRIPQVEVNDLRENTYYALITLQQGDRRLEVDARPSDAVAIALRAGAEIYVDDTVLAKSRPAKGTPAAEADSEEAKKWAEILEDLNPDAFKYKM
jgi:bifunctional DNase/RNase